MNIYFTDYFNIGKDILDEYEAFDISLINELPVLIDQFPLFTSEKINTVVFPFLADFQQFMRGMVKETKNIK